jgi:hypothetical protein
MISTFCPAVMRPACRPLMAASPETATVAACSKLSLAGLRTSFSSRAATYSANEPRPMPNTSSPTWNLVTPTPVEVTMPATSSPGTRCFGPRNPKPRIRIRYGSPRIR